MKKFRHEIFDLFTAYTHVHTPVEKMKKFRHGIFDLFAAYTHMHTPVEKMKKFRHKIFDLFTAYTHVHALFPRVSPRSGMINTLCRHIMML